MVVGVCIRDDVDRRPHGPTLTTENSNTFQMEPPMPQSHDVVAARQLPWVMTARVYSAWIGNRRLPRVDAFNLSRHRLLLNDGEFVGSRQPEQSKLNEDAKNKSSRIRVATDAN